MRGNLDRLLGQSKEQYIEVDDREFCELLTEILNDGSSSRIAERVSRWKLESTDRRLERIASQARGLADRLDKGALDVEVDSRGLMLEPRRWSRFWSGFAHAVRNAVDHGIEATDERVAAGKTPNGKISLRAACRDDEFVIEIIDDGRGVDWQTVRSKADAAGIEVDTTSDLTELLFRDGFSTRSVVSEHSGRGVGMAVLRQATEELGGRVQLNSSPGQGTSVRFIFPEKAMAPPPKEMLQELQAAVASG